MYPGSPRVTKIAHTQNTHIHPRTHIRSRTLTHNTHTHSHTNGQKHTHTHTHTHTCTQSLKCTHIHTQTAMKTHTKPGNADRHRHRHTHTHTHTHTIWPSRVGQGYRGHLRPSPPTLTSGSLLCSGSEAHAERLARRLRDVVPDAWTSGLWTSGRSLDGKMWHWTPGESRGASGLGQEGGSDTERPGMFPSGS